MTADTRLLRATALDAEGRRKVFVDLGLNVPEDTSTISLGQNLILAAHASDNGRVDLTTLDIIQKNLLDEKAKWSFKHPK